MENVLQSELLRAVNDRIFRSVVEEGEEVGSFACECGSASCAQRIEIPPVEYAAGRDRRLISPEHVIV
jgi:hypothetical protein